MRFDRESWRKLYVAESAEHRLLPLFTRGLRDYLLRSSQDDGTILRSTKDPTADLARVLSVEPPERKPLERALKELLEIGYLSHSRGRLWITRFEDAQAARSPGAKRQAAYKARVAAEQTPTEEASPIASPLTSPKASPGDVSGDKTGDVTREETRRDETTTTASPPVGAVDFEVPCPADLTLTDAQIGTINTGNPIPSGAISWLTRRFVANYQADQGDKRTLVVWRKCLSKAVSGGWGNANVKSEYLAQAKATATDNTGGYGRAEDWQ